MASLAVMATASVTPGLFDRKLPPRIILASFFFLTLPLAGFFALTQHRWFVWIYLWVFGLTHFVLTLSVYLQSGNLKYFAATAKNVVLFFLIPLAILMGFYVAGVFQLNAQFPALALALSVAIRALDFNHLNRQTYGVYQMFKARTGVRQKPMAKHFEQAYLICLTALLLTTFLAGGVCPLPVIRDSAFVASFAKAGEAIVPVGILQIVFAALLGIAGLLALVQGGLLVSAWRESGRPHGIVQAFGYLGIQTLAAVFGMVSFRLYFATLATHYIEYHVLMYPRCFGARLDESNGLDRWFEGLRRNPAVFYGVTLAAAGMVLAFTTSSGIPTLSLPYRAIVSIFDGLFVFHYFVEMLIWRFSNPYFRKSLGALYLAPRPR